MINLVMKKLPESLALKKNITRGELPGGRDPNIKSGQYLMSPIPARLPRLDQLVAEFVKLNNIELFQC